MLTLLFAAACAGFAWLTWRKLAIVVHLAPDPRGEQPFDRLRTVLVDGLLQRRMLLRDWKPGLMHAVIFAGFLTLLVRKVELLVIGYYEPFTYPGALGDFFTVAKDVVEVALLVALAYAFGRRFVHRPARLEPNREALLVLTLILVIVVSDLAFDAFRFTLFAAADPHIARERDFAFFGRALADAVAAWPPAALNAGYVGSYWLQIVVVFSFLVLLPAGEHFHIVTALPTLYFRRGRPANAVPAVDLTPLYADDADPDKIRIGAVSARDLTWKEGLDVFTCTECGRCKDACPTFLTGKPLSQKWVNDSVKHHLLAQRAALVAGGDAALPPLVPDVIGEETLWACTTCGYCEEACPIELEHLPRFFRLRQHRVMMDGEFPAPLKPIFAAYEAQGNPWGFPADQRGAWANGLGVPVVESKSDLAGLEYLYYVGSAASYDPRAQRIAKAFVAVLKAAGVRFGILGAREASTGECVRRLGNEMLYQQLAQTLATTLQDVGATRVVTTDPHAFNSLRHELPAFGVACEVVHHTQLIAQLMAAGRLPVSPRYSRVLLHEPCYLGRHNGEYEAPRAILRRLVQDPLLEFPLHREKAMCCGAGGGRMWMEEEGKRINVLRVEQGLPHDPAVIATACPYCAVMITDGVAAVNRGDAIATRDIAELVADALAPVPAAA
ncbi:MAG: (Fe-S)-binding protein [Burkholderiales bacterium]